MSRHSSMSNLDRQTTEFGVNFFFKSIKPQLSLQVTKEVLEQFKIEGQDKFQIGGCSFRMTATAQFVSDLVQSNQTLGGSVYDTSFCIFIQNAEGYYSADGKNLQMIATVDVIRQFNIGTNLYYIYEVVQPWKFFQQIGINQNYLIGFGLINQDNKIIPLTTDFVSHYKLTIQFE